MKTQREALFGVKQSHFPGGPGHQASRQRLHQQPLYPEKCTNRPDCPREHVTFSAPRTHGRLFIALCMKPQLQDLVPTGLSPF